MNKNLGFQRNLCTVNDKDKRKKECNVLNYFELATRLHWINKKILIFVDKDISGWINLRYSHVNIMGEYPFLNYENTKIPQKWLSCRKHVRNLVSKIILKIVWVWISVYIEWKTRNFFLNDLFLKWLISENGSSIFFPIIL